jgi:protein phosphatase
MHEHDALGAPAREEIAVAPLSDPGRVRTENQDALAVLENTSSERLILVADGMGGHRGGETASKICLQIVERIFREPHGTPEQRLRRGLELANEEIYSHALANPELKGMGTTAVVALIGPDRSVWIAWVGDSRCYRLRDGALESLTRDHSLMAEWIAIGVISPDAAQTHPRRHELTRALGQSPDVTVDLLSTELRPGDRLLLCSDGLHGYVPDRPLKYALSHGGPEEAARALVDAANANGGSDNVTVIVVALPASSVAASAPTPAAVVEPPAPPLVRAADVAAAPGPEPVFAADLTAPAEIANELDLFAAPMADMRAEPAPPVVAEPSPSLDPDVSFADLDTEIAEVVEESASVTEAAEIAPSLEPAADPAAEFLLPSAQHIEIPLMTPVRASRRRGLDATSVLAGIGGTLLIAALGFGAWLYTGSSRVAVPQAVAQQPRPAVARTQPAAPQPAPARAPAPAVALAPVPAVAPAPAPAPVVPPAPVVAPASEPTPVPAPAPVVTHAPAPAVAPSAAAPSAPPATAHVPPREPVTVAAATPSPPPSRPTETESVPAAADPSASLALPTSKGFELPPHVTRFVDDWLRALQTHDHALLATLGFPDEPAAFAGSAGSRDGYRLVAAEVDEERSSEGRVYLRMVVSYAFRDANGRFRTQDEQRLILRESQGRLRFEGRWQQ